MEGLVTYSHSLEEEASDTTSAEDNSISIVGSRLYWNVGGVQEIDHLDVVEINIQVAPCESSGWVLSDSDLNDIFLDNLEDVVDVEAAGQVNNDVLCNDRCCENYSD